MDEEYLPPVHTNRTSRFDILEQKHTILWCTVNGRHEVSRFIRSKPTGLLNISYERCENEDHRPNRNKREIESTKHFPNLLEHRAYGHFILVLPVEHGAVRSIATEEHFHLVRFDDPRGPERLETIEDSASCEVLARRAGQLELLAKTALGRSTVIVRLSHQSRQWKRSAGIPIEEK